MIKVMTPVFRATSTASFDGLYRRHAASVYRFAYAVLGNHADAEDITQQTFLNAYRAISQGTKPRKAENWLLTIAHNEVRRHFRDSREKSLEVELDEGHAHPAPEPSDPSVADVLRALQHLPPTQRTALVMREFEGRSYAEIAQIMDVTQSALEALIFRARRSLAEQLEEGLTCAEAERGLSRRLDGRLPRREARRLRVHMKECPRCSRFEWVQRRQRSLLKGLSVMPVPASVFLFRGESAAAGSVAVGTGGAAAGAGTAGIATGLLAKAAAVTAAAAVTGGVSYGVAAGLDPVTKAKRNATHAVAVTQTRSGGRAGVQLGHVAWSGGEQPAPARSASPRAQQTGMPRAMETTVAEKSARTKKQKLPKAEKAKASGQPGTPPGKPAVKAKKRHVKAHAVKPARAKPLAPKARSRPELRKPIRPERAATKPPPVPKELPEVANPNEPAKLVPKVPVVKATKP